MIYQLLLTTLLLTYAHGRPSEKIPANTIPATGIIYRSTDLGLSWESVSEGLPKEARVMYLEAQGNNLFMGTDNYGIYAGNTKTKKWWPAAHLTFNTDESITGLYADGQDLYATLYRNGFFKSTDVGNIWMPWVPMHKNMEEEDKVIRTVLKYKNKLFVGTDTGVFSTTDHGKTWKEVFGEGQVNTLVEQNGILFGGTYRGLIRSRDQGASWEWIQEEGMVYKALVIKDRLVVLNQFGEIQVSRDSGQRWQRIDQGLPSNQSVHDLANVQGVLICSHKQGLYRSSDWGAHWELIHKTPDKDAFLRLAVADGILYFFRGGGC